MEKREDLLEIVWAETDPGKPGNTLIFKAKRMFVAAENLS
jgi:hypothetical protein